MTPDQRRAFAAAFFGWMLDGFDFTMLTFVLIDIRQSFTIDNALAGALGTVTLMFRLLGGVLAGTAADRWGRKLPLLASIVWFSIFSVLSGFSTSYAMLFLCRALFGIGMGGEWAAGMPLALEHLPDELRGAAAGVLQGAWAWGYIASALAFHYIYPLIRSQPDFAWRVMLWTSAVPALVVLWIRARVKESPVWLERRGAAGVRPGISLARIFKRDLLGTTVQCAVLMAAFMVSYYAVTFWYPTFLLQSHLPTLPYLIALNLGGIAGAAVWGWSSEARLGRRGAVTLAMLLGVGVTPLYLLSTDPVVLLGGAFLVGSCAHGAWGTVPSYLSERFPAAVRGAGVGFSYHAGLLLGSVTPLVIGYMQDSGIRLAMAMAVCSAFAGLAVAGLIWLGPETRGRTLAAEEPGLKPARAPW